MNLSFVLGLLLVGVQVLDVYGLCARDKHCDGDQYCKWFKWTVVPYPRCVDLCDGDDRSCGANAYCIARDHARWCTCREGYTGRPDKGCSPLEVTCKCGPNTNCETYGNTAFCGCKDGFAGNPYDRNQGCTPAPGLVDAAKCWSEDRDDPSPSCVGYFNHRTGKQFFIMQYETNWFDALRMCEVGGKMLAIIENRHDQETLEETLLEQGLSNQKLWLAGSDLKKQGKFQWVAGSTFNTVQFTNWLDSEPGGNGQHCVALTHRYSWVTEDCSQSLMFVCQNK